MPDVSPEEAVIARKTRRLASSFDVSSRLHKDNLIKIRSMTTTTTMFLLGTTMFPLGTRNANHHAQSSDNTGKEHRGLDALI